MFVAVALLLASTTSSAAALSEVIQFGTNPGNLRMFKHVPPLLPLAAPLVVALHGCTQHASDFDDETGWIELAERFRFALLFPEQRDENNSRLCFNWFNGWWVTDFWLWREWGSDQDRGEGEALSIKQMIDKMKSEHRLDPKRVYIAGLSAGGAMTAVMLAAYPELFAGGAIFAGAPYKCARTAGEALTQCGIDLGNNGNGHTSDLSAAAWAARVRGAGDFPGPWPRVSIWHGEADKTVDPANSRELLEQWTAVQGLDPAGGVADKVKGHAHVVYRDANGTARVESYSIAGLGHAVPIDPGTGADKCGRAGAHTTAVGICASFYAAKFWGLIP